jgi:hypothetical protein
MSMINPPPQIQHLLPRPRLPHDKLPRRNLSRITPVEVIRDAVLVGEHESARAVIGPALQQLLVGYVARAEAVINVGAAG